MAQRLGVAVPRTALLPSRSYAADVTAESLRNLRFPLDWEGLVRELGFPMFIKPHWGGGFRDVYRVTSLDELFAAYGKTGKLAMIAQQAIPWTQYVRCIVIGCDRVRPALWDPRLGHFERYAKAAENMPPLSAELEARVVRDAQTLCRALGYTMNTVEFGIADGIPYAIDFMNSAPDFDITSLGPDHFAWVVSEMARLVVDLAKRPAEAPKLGWQALLG
jgi:hypothetical protein